MHTISTKPTFLLSLHGSPNKVRKSTVLAMFKTSGLLGCTMISDCSLSVDGFGVGCMVCIYIAGLRCSQAHMNMKCYITTTLPVTIMA